MLTADELRSIF